MFFFERNKRKQAEAALENADSEAKDQLLKYKQGENSSKLEEEKSKLNKLKEDHDSTTKENQENLSPEQVEQYWKKKPGS